MAVNCHGLANRSDHSTHTFRIDRNTMARTTKTTVKKKANSKRATSAKSTSTKSAPRKSRPAAQKAKSGRATEIERRWATYLKQRTMLEEVVKAVSMAEEALAKFRDDERELRDSFNSSKMTLEQLLEVQSATSAEQGARDEAAPEVLADDATEAPFDGPSSEVLTDGPTQAPFDGPSSEVLTDGPTEAAFDGPSESGTPTIRSLDSVPFLGPIEPADKARLS